MKYKTQGNCPYCDSERGIHEPWGMSPEGLAALREKHEKNHPENPNPQPIK